MTDRRPPDDEDFGAGSGAESTAPATGSGGDPDPALEVDVAEADMPPIDEFAAESGDDPIGAVTDFMDDLVEADVLDDDSEADEVPLD